MLEPREGGGERKRAVSFKQFVIIKSNLTRFLNFFPGNCRGIKKPFMTGCCFSNHFLNDTFCWVCVLVISWRLLLDTRSWYLQICSHTPKKNPTCLALSSIFPTPLKIRKTNVISRMANGWGYDDVIINFLTSPLTCFWSVLSIWFNSNNCENEIKNTRQEWQLICPSHLFSFLTKTITKNSTY